MSRCRVLGWRGICAFASVVLVALSPSDGVKAQINPGLGIGNTVIARQVGGVVVNVDGVLNNVDPRNRKELAELRRKALDRVPVAMSETTELRMISLRA